MNTNTFQNKNDFLLLKLGSISPTYVLFKVPCLFFTGSVFLLQNKADHNGSLEVSVQHKNYAFENGPHDVCVEFRLFLVSKNQFEDLIITSYNSSWASNQSLDVAAASAQW